MSVYNLVIKLLGQDAGASAALRGLKGETTGLTGATNLLSTAIAGLTAGGIVALGKKAMETAFEMGQLGAQAMRMEVAFGDLATQAGGSADAMLAAMQKATGGTVSNANIIAAANRGILLGLGANADQWAQLAEVAQYRSRAMGISMTQALNDIVTGIGRESRLILDNLGIIVDVDAVTQEYAKTLGVTAEQLSATERKQAILNAVISDGQERIAASGGLNADAAASFEALQVSIDNLREAANKWVVESTALVPNIDLLVAILNGASGAELAQAFLDAAYGGSAFAEVLVKILPGLNEYWKVQEGIDADSARWSAMAEQYAGALDEVGDASDRAASSTGTLSAKARVLPNQFIALANAIRSVSFELNRLTVDEVGQEFESAANQAQRMLAGLTDVDIGVLSGKWAEVESALKDASFAFDPKNPLAYYQAVNQVLGGLEDWVGGYEDLEDAASDAMKAQQSGWDDLKSTVEAALQASGVTAEDLAATASGSYVDKWDENIRRLNAIAERGFAEIQAHPDWVDLLSIPPEVLAGTQEQLQQWAANTAQAAPTSMFDIDKAVELVEQYVAQQAAQEALVEEVARAYAEKHGLSIGAAREEIGAVMGTPEDQGASMAERITAGFTGELEDSGPAAAFARVLLSDVSASAAELKGAGESLWHAAEVGIDAAMKSSNYVNKWVELLAPLVAKYIKTNDVWAGQP